MGTTTYFTNDDDWLHVLSLLPEDLEVSCRTKLAVERFREIRSASDLLRLYLAYGVCDMSLRQAAAWASTIGLGQMSNVAVLKRLRSGGDWLGYLIVQWLSQRGLTSQVPPMQVRVVDGSVVTTPGQQAQDYRIHLGFDLARMRVADVELTPTSEGESLQRHIRGRGEVLLADRGYGKPPQVAAALSGGAHVVVRIHYLAMPLETLKGRRLDTLSLLETLSSHEIGDWPVFLRHGKRRFALRLVAVKKSRAAAAQAIAKAKRKAQKNGTVKADSRSLRAAPYTYLLTDLTGEEISAPQVLELYRLRWQIELAFKRIKSLLHLNLRAKGDAIVRTYLLANILGALLVDELCDNALSFFPWGFRLIKGPYQPLEAL
jgi:hypothetical protein